MYIIFLAILSTRISTSQFAKGTNGIVTPIKLISAKNKFHLQKFESALLSKCRYLSCHHPQWSLFAVIQALVMILAVGKQNLLEKKKVSFFLMITMICQCLVPSTNTSFVVCLWCLNQFKQNSGGKVPCAVRRQFSCYYNELSLWAGILVLLPQFLSMLNWKLQITFS